MKRLLLATANRGKVNEIALLLEGVTIETLADHPEIQMPEETGATFAENARDKAEHVARLLALPVLADDSGLVVDALGGEPGVRSARYAPGSDLDRVHKLLAALAGVAPEARSARFVCALAFAVPGQSSVLVEGRVEGRIAASPRGSSGFGYDPVFLVGPDHLRTMAELEVGEKNRISHRGRALQALRARLVDHFSLEPS